MGLNKKARVSLEGYWPICKTNRVSIKDPDRLADMDYVGKLRRSTEKIGAHFIDYIPQTGTCIFEASTVTFYAMNILTMATVTSCSCSCRLITSLSIN